jgi:hypothetical protein
MDDMDTKIAVQTQIKELTIMTGWNHKIKTGRSLCDI